MKQYCDEENMTTLSARDQIRQFIIDNFGQSRNVTTLSDGDSLLEKGVIDSLTIFRLVSFLEETFSVRISDEDITPTNLESVNVIARLVELKGSQAVSQGA